MHPVQSARLVFYKRQQPINCLRNPLIFFLSKKVDPAILYRQNDRVYKRVGLWPDKMLPIVIGNQHMHITSNSSRENIITE